MNLDYKNYFILGMIGVGLNIFLSLSLKQFATDDEIKPPKGAAKLSFKGQFMHMMVHHAQVLPMSSLIVFLVVFLSALLKDAFKL